MSKANRGFLFPGLAVLICVALLLFWSKHWWSAGKVPCEQRQAFTEAASPDGSWIARAYENVCGGGFGTTYVDDTVEIARPDGPGHPEPTDGVVFQMEYSYNRPRPIALKWLNERQIEVTIPNDAWAGTQQLAFADIIISYRYIGDDPVERACIKQWRAAYRRNGTSEFVAYREREGVSRDVPREQRASPIVARVNLISR